MPLHNISSLAKRAIMKRLVVALFSIILINALPNPNAYGDCLKSWTEQDTGYSYTLYGITYGNHQFVAVGQGNILTSSDGITWTPRPGATNMLKDVCYGDSMYFAVGENGTILTSPDAVTWTQRVSGTTLQLEGIAYLNNAYFAVGGNGTILHSTDGITWTAGNSGTTRWLSDICYGDGTYVIVGLSGDPSTILTSKDGTNWVSRSPETSVALTDVIFQNGVFYAVGLESTLLRSENGAFWEKLDMGIGSDQLWSIAYANDIFVVAGSHQILTSPDGITWTSGSPYGWGYDLANGGNRFVAVGNGGGIFTSGLCAIGQPPVANAGPDQTAVDQVSLDGSASYDLDDDIASFEWQLNHRLNPDFHRTASGEIASVANLEPGFYDVTLIVTDSEGSVGRDTMVLGVSGNIPWDVNGDGVTGLEEVIHTLQDLSGVRSE